MVFVRSDIVMNAALYMKKVGQSWPCGAGSVDWP